MDELKRITAKNIIRLRTRAGLTQTELGNLLSYSDKSVSKWERAEGIPDAYVLKKMSEIFGVTVDALLSEPEEIAEAAPEATEAQPEEIPEEISASPGRSFSSKVVTTIALMGIWTAALLLFVVFWMLGKILWQVFILAVPISLVTLLVLNSVWEGGRYNQWIIGALVFSVIAGVYFLLYWCNPWQLFLLVPPAELLVALGFRVKQRKSP